MPMLFILVLALLLLPAFISAQRHDALDPLHRPIRGVRKMSNDEGEKFFWHYWQFEDEMGNYSHPDSNRNTAGEEIRTRSCPLRPALSIDETQSRNGRGLFQRDFECPDGTKACAAINRPNRCCDAGDTCQLVQDAGPGDAGVGCCPAGQTCLGEIGSCPAGYSTCSGALGGGCCIPGYDCVQGGCESADKCPKRSPFSHRLTFPV